MDRRTFIRNNALALATTGMALTSSRRAAGATPVGVQTPSKRFLRLLPNGYFAFEDGKVFLPLGGFYGNFLHRVKDGVVQPDMITSIRDSSEAEKRAWFSVLADHGVNCLRIMSRDHTGRGVDEWDKVGAVNTDLLEDWERYWAIALEYGIHILPTLHESYYATYAPYRNAEVMQAMVTPLYKEAELAALPEYRRRFLSGDVITDGKAMYTDPDIVRCREDYINALIPRLRDNPGILFYELENEQAPDIHDWTNKNIAWIRRHDPKTPIAISHSGDGVFHADPIPHSRSTNIDFYSYHLYPVGSVTARALDYGCALSMHARYVMLGVPAGSGESGAHILKNGPTGAWRRALARDTAWIPFLSGNCHVMFWDAAHPEVVACKGVAEIVDLLDLATFKRKRPTIAVDVSHSLENDQFFKSERGRKMYAVMGRYEQHFMRLGVEFDYTMGGSHYATVLPGDTFEPIVPGDRPFALSDGYEMRLLMSEDDSTVVAYVRNRGETVRLGEGWFSGWVRKPRPAPFRLDVALPGAYEGFLHAFESGVRQDVRLDGSARLGGDVPGEDDYLLFLKRS